MRARRQNIQLELALEPVAKGEARSPDTQGTEARTAHAEPERPAAGLRRTAVYGPVRTVVWEGRSREAPPYPDWRYGPAGDSAPRLRLKRLVWPKGSFRPVQHGPPPPFSLINSHPFGSARSSPGREAAKRTLDG